MSDTRSIFSVAISDSVREELGDIQALAQSISRVGLLHPVVVDGEGNLIAGRRRLEAVRSLGWSEVPVTVVDLDEPLIAQRDENSCRKEFTNTEKVAIARAIQVKESVAAKERQGRPSQPRSEKVTEHSESKAVAAKAVGMSRPTFERLERVVDANNENPAVYGDLVHKLDNKEISVAEADRERERRHYAQLPPDPNAEREQRTARISREVISAIQGAWSRVFLLDFASLLPDLGEPARNVLQDASTQMRRKADEIDRLLGRRLKSVKGDSG